MPPDVGSRSTSTDGRPASCAWCASAAANVLVPAPPTAPTTTTRSAAGAGSRLRPNRSKSHGAPAGSSRTCSAPIATRRRHTSGSSIVRETTTSPGRGSGESARRRVDEPGVQEHQRCQAPQPSGSADLCRDDDLDLRLTGDGEHGVLQGTVGGDEQGAGDGVRHLTPSKCGSVSLSEVPGSGDAATSGLWTTDVPPGCAPSRAPGRHRLRTWDDPRRGDSGGRQGAWPRGEGARRVSGPRRTRYQHRVPDRLRSAIGSGQTAPPRPRQPPERPNPR